MANGICRCSPKLSYRPLEEHRLPRFGIRHGSAARTGRDTNPYRCSVFDRCSPLPAVANRQFVRAPCALVVSTPRAARVEASQRSAHAPVAAAPLPRDAQARYPDASGRKGISVVEWMEPGRCMRILRERWKQNAPGACDPRAFAFPREIGVADLPGSQPDVRWPDAARVRCRAWHRTHTHARAGRSAMAAGQACWRWSARASWKSFW